MTSAARVAFGFILLIHVVASLSERDLQLVQVHAQWLTSQNYSGETTLPNLLVIAADHGEGTSTLSGALGAHPCIIDVGEPFSTMQRWYEPNGLKALLASDGKSGDQETYSKLQAKLDNAMKERKAQLFTLSGGLHRTYPNMLDFFKAVRAETCEHVELPRTCKSACVIAFKLFPSFISYNFSLVDDLLRSKGTMVLQVLRDEDAVIRSNSERFGGMGQRAINGLKAWNKHLNGLQTEMSTTKVWTTIDMNADTFKSPESYLQVLKPHLLRLGLSAKEASTAPMLANIKSRFQRYANKKASKDSA